MSVASLLADTSLAVDEDGVYTRDIPATWAGTSGIVGGYSLALVAAAIGDFLDAQDQPAATHELVSLTTHFLRPVAAGAARIEITPVRVGRTTSYWQVQLHSLGRIAIQATAIACRPLSEARFDGTDPPATEMPGEDEQPWDPAVGLPAHDQFWFWPRPADSAQDAGWILPRGAFPNDARLVAMISDLWPPPVLHRFDQPATVVGLNHSLHIHTPDIASVTRPGDPLLVTLRTAIAAGGTVDETTRIWSADRALVATSNQVRLILPTG